MFHQVCLVYSGGELTIMEYGSSEVLGSVRTEFVNSNLISVRVNERKLKDTERCKRLAYLLDLHTICISMTGYSDVCESSFIVFLLLVVAEDLYYGTSLANITHDSKIDWLKVNMQMWFLIFTK